MKKFVVMFWLITGAYEETVYAYTSWDARKAILKKYAGKNCEIRNCEESLTLEDYENL
jgi:hypothetical protein